MIQRGDIVRDTRTQRFIRVRTATDKTVSGQVLETGVGARVRRSSCIVVFRRGY